MRGKMRRPSGDWAMRSRAISCVGNCVMSLPSKMNRPVRARGIPKIVIIKRGLAGAVGTDQSDDLARIRVDCNTAQRTNIAVVGFNAFNAEKGLLSLPLFSPPGSF